MRDVILIDTFLNNILRSSLVSLKANLVDDVPLFHRPMLALYSHCFPSVVIVLSGHAP